MKIIHYYRTTPTPHSLIPSLTERLTSAGVQCEILSLATEVCFNIQLADGSTLDDVSTQRLEWLLRETFDRDGLRLESTSLTAANDDNTVILEFGPRNSFASAFSSNATSICAAIHLPIARLEKSRRYAFTFSSAPTPSDISTLCGLLHDRMTEERYMSPVSSFEIGVTPKSVEFVKIMEEGRSALETINREKGLGFDEFDLDFYTELFKVSIKPVSYVFVAGFNVVAVHLDLDVDEYQSILKPYLLLFWHCLLYLIEWRQA